MTPSQPVIETNRKPQLGCQCGNTVFRLAVTSAPRIAAGEPVALECTVCGRLKIEPR